MASRQQISTRYKLSPRCDQTSLHIRSVERDNLFVGTHTRLDRDQNQPEEQNHPSNHESFDKSRREIRYDSFHHLVVPSHRNKNVETVKTYLTPTLMKTFVIWRMILFLRLIFVSIRPSVGANK